MARFTEPRWLERALSELQHAPELSYACSRALVELKEHVEAIETTTEFIPRRHEAAEDQRRIIEAQKRTIKDQKKRLEDRKRIHEINEMSLGVQDDRIKILHRIIQNQGQLMGRRDRSIQRLRDELQRMSAQVAMAEDLSGKEKGQAMSVSGRCYCTYYHYRSSLCKRHGFACSP